MKLFKKIARAAGATAKKEKADAAAAGADPADEPTATDDGAESAAAARDAGGEAPGKLKTGGPASSGGDKGAASAAQEGGAMDAEEEARLRSKYEALGKENKDLKQRNGFLLQMLAASQLDEKQLEEEIRTHQQLLSPGGSISSSIASPIRR